MSILLQLRSPTKPCFSFPSVQDIILRILSICAKPPSNTKSNLFAATPLLFFFLTLLKRLHIIYWIAFFPSIQNRRVAAPVHISVHQYAEIDVTRYNETFNIEIQTVDMSRNVWASIWLYTQYSVLSLDWVRISHAGVGVATILLHMSLFACDFAISVRCFVFTFQCSVCLYATWIKSCLSLVRLLAFRSAVKCGLAFAVRLWDYCGIPKNEDQTHEGKKY